MTCVLNPPCAACLATDNRELRAQVEQLQHWKNEALIVFDWWDQVWVALGSPGRLGDVRSAACLAAIEQLTARATTAERDADDLAEYARHTEGCNAPHGYRCKCRYDEFAAAHIAAVATRGAA